MVLSVGPLPVTALFVQAHRFSYGAIDSYLNIEGCHHMQMSRGVERDRRKALTVRYRRVDTVMRQYA